MNYNDTDSSTMISSLLCYVGLDETDIDPLTAHTLLNTNENSTISRPTQLLCIFLSCLFGSFDRHILLLERVVLLIQGKKLDCVSAKEIRVFSVIFLVLSDKQSSMQD
jgi:hypothetical protein